MSSIVFSNLTNCDACQGTGEDGPEDTCGQTKVTNKEEGSNQETACSNKGCVMQGLGRVHRLEDFHRTDTDEGEDQADHRQTKRQQHRSGLSVQTTGGSTKLGQQHRACGRSDGDGCDNRTDIGFEDIRAHTGGITNAITNIVSDNAWVTWIVFGNTGFNLADQVRTDISGLGVDATTNTGKESN